MIHLDSISKWVVTGGAGFIGSHLVRELVHQGQQVTVVDNFTTGSMDNLHLVKDKITIVNADIRNLADLKSAFNGADYVLHHAALISVPESMAKPAETMEINVQGTTNVLQAALECKVKRVVFASSSAVYGTRPELPYRETTLVDCQSPYALSKHIGAELCTHYAKVYGLEAISLRYFNVFGSGQNPNSAYAAVIAKFMQLANAGKPLGIDWDGLQSRDFVHVSDVVQANLLVALKGAPGEVYNVASGKIYSLLDLANTIESIIGHPLERIFRPKRAGDVRLNSADITKIQNLGFTPTVTLKEGLSGMWQDLQTKDTK